MTVEEIKVANDPLWQHALLLLARREHSQCELKQKLLAKGYDLLEIQKLLASLRAEGLQSDERYAEAYVRQRIEVGFGPYRIRAELQHRGVSDSLIDSIVPRDEVFWWEILPRVWKKKKNLQSEVRFLMQRGFDASLIYRWIRLTEKHADIHE